MLSKELYIIIHNIRSAYNVGAVFRSSDGAGVRKIYLTGYTPAPFREGVDLYETQAYKMISKTALGAEKIIPWSKEKNISKVIRGLKKEGVKIIALEEDKNAVDYKRFVPQFPCALILGNEVRGIDKKILNKCDAIISIPMRGQKESLNVSVAAGIAIYEILH